MACKDKKQDVEMLRSISEREVQKTSKLPYLLVDLTWTGTLLDIQSQVQDLNNVLYITKLKDNEYIATVIEYQN